MTSAVAERSERIANLVLTVLAGALAIALSGAVAAPAVALAQASGVPVTGPSASSSVAPAATASPATGTPGTTAPATPPPSTISPTISGTRAKSARPAPRPRSHRQHKAAHKTPEWVIQPKAQLALEGDPRFKNVHATITQPGVIVLEGDVFDNDAKSAAEAAVAGVQGVKRVINALTTQSLQWLVLQNRINQALQQNGLALVSVKVIGKTAFMSGQVSKSADKDRAVLVVKSAAPDLTIGTNLIQVKTSGL
jgi:hypothetical protein